MTEEYIDITSFVKSFSVNISMGIPAQDKNGLYKWSYNLLGQNTYLTFDDPSQLDMSQKDIDYVMYMNLTGRFWFDKKIEGDVVISNIELAEGGGVTATYKSKNMVDHTNYGIIARFLRWALRR